MDDGINWERGRQRELANGLSAFRKAQGVRPIEISGVTPTPIELMWLKAQGILWDEVIESLEG